MDVLVYQAAARKLKSGALMADAWHHRSDALSSVGAFIGILGARMGVPVMDPLASFVICIFIVKAALDVFRDSMDKMVDKACDEETDQIHRAGGVRYTGSGTCGLHENKAFRFQDIC